MIDMNHINNIFDAQEDLNTLTAEICAAAKKLAANEVKKAGYHRLKEVKNSLLKNLIEKINKLDKFIDEQEEIKKEKDKP